jgi:ATP-dependent Zn protease
VDKATLQILQMVVLGGSLLLCAVFLLLLARSPRFTAALRRHPERWSIAGAAAAAVILFSFAALLNSNQAKGQLTTEELLADAAKGRVSDVLVTVSPQTVVTLKDGRQTYVYLTGDVPTVLQQLRNAGVPVHQQSGTRIALIIGVGAVCVALLLMALGLLRYTAREQRKNASMHPSS